MKVFSKITPLLLALAIGFNAIGQVQTASQADRAFSENHRDDSPAYRDISAPVLWAVINMEKEASNLLRVHSMPDPEEDQKYHSKPDLAQESALERYVSIFLNLSRNIISSPSISELLYPFYFYF